MQQKEVKKMSKIWKLFINENIKTWKKLSTKIMIIVAIVAIIGTLGLVKIMQKTSENVIIADNSDNWRKSIEQEMKYMEEQLKNDELDEATKASYEQQIEMYKISLEYDVSPWKMNYWKTDLIQEISNLKMQQKYSLEENEINKLDTEITNLIDKLTKDDYEGYIDLQIAEQKTQFDNGQISEQEYKDKVKILDITKKSEIGKELNDPYWKQTLIREIESAQASVRTNIDKETGKVLTVEKKQEYEDLIKINEYRLENNTPPSVYSENYRTIFEILASMFGVAVIAIIVIVIAGGTISSEVSTGSIKFWALTPNKRWKILTAKILSVLFYIIVITLLIVAITIVISNVFFRDTETGDQYIYVKNGEIKVIESNLFIFEQYFVKIIPVVIFVLFAIMLSTLTRNSATSISFSLALYLGNGIAMSIINSFIKSEWIKFIPFNNLNIFDKIFTNYTSPINFSMGTSFTSTTPLTFSLAVLGVCAILMLVTMYDSFNKRDII